MSLTVAAESEPGARTTPTTNKQGIHNNVAFRAGTGRFLWWACWPSATNDPLLKMLAVVPSIEFGFVGGIDVHRGQQHSFASERHFATVLIRVILEHDPEKRKPVFRKDHAQIER